MYVGAAHEVSTLGGAVSMRLPLALARRAGPTWSLRPTAGDRPPGLRRGQHSVALMVNILLIRRAPPYAYATLPLYL